ncbi:MAG TPA: CoA transferase [Candidatus Acidoferrales bacterium]|nr:CoA transferase [Candidatus Acidoferrales bacterium]
MLDGLRVVELAGRDVWGASAVAHCGRILADLGADVVKAEPPGGDPVRRVPPYIGDRADPDRGLLWIALNASKRGVVLDPADTPRRSALLRDADVVVQPSLLVDPASDPRLVVVTITPYGATGPLADTPASDLEVTAASGSLWLAGEPGGAPVRTTLPQSPFWTGMYGAAGALLAIFERRTTGRGQHVDVSGQQSMVTVHPPAPVFADVAKEEHMRLGPNLLGRSIVGARFRNIWPCADGHVSFAIQGGPIGRHTGRMLAAWMAERGFAAPRFGTIDWETFDNRTLSQADVDALEAEIGAFLRTLTKREFFAGVIARNMLGYPVADAADIYDDEQLRARAFWQDVAIDGTTLSFPGGFALFDGERPRIRRGAPRLGEHTAEIVGRVTA